MNTDTRRRAKTATSVAVGLRLWAESHDAHVRAAVELLIRHGVWLRRADLLAAALHRDLDGSYWIDWTALRHELDAGHLDRSGVKDRALLDLALDVATDRYRLSAMGTGNARLIADAVTAALGLPLPRRTDPTGALTNGVTP